MFCLSPRQSLTKTIMDCSESKVGFSEEELLEPLIITEDEDTTTGEATSSSDAILQSCGRDSALEKKEEHLGEDEHNEAAECGEMHSEELKLEEPQSNTEPLEQQHRAENEMNTDDGLNSEKYGSEEVTKVDEEKEESMENKQKPEGEKQENEDAKKVSELLCS